MPISDLPLWMEHLGIPQTEQREFVLQAQLGHCPDAVVREFERMRRDLRRQDRPA